MQVAENQFMWVNVRVTFWFWVFGQNVLFLLDKNRSEFKFIFPWEFQEKSRDAKTEFYFNKRSLRKIIIEFYAVLSDVSLKLEKKSPKKHSWNKIWFWFSFLRIFFFFFLSGIQNFMWRKKVTFVSPRPPYRGGSFLSAWCSETDGTR